SAAAREPGVARRPAARARRDAGNRRDDAARLAELAGAQVALLQAQAIERSRFQRLVARSELMHRLQERGRESEAPAELFATRSGSSGASPSRMRGVTGPLQFRSPRKRPGAS